MLPPGEGNAVHSYAVSASSVFTMGGCLPMGVERVFMWNVSA
jgi:hypothetical protein